jgi:hypothetical protein
VKASKLAGSKMDCNINTEETLSSLTAIYHRPKWEGANSFPLPQMLLFPGEIWQPTNSRIVEVSDLLQVAEYEILVVPHDTWNTAAI